MIRVLVTATRFASTTPVDSIVTAKRDSNWILSSMPALVSVMAEMFYLECADFSILADVNECQINNHECLEHQRCDNTIGSYTCIRLHSCGTGYTFNAATANCDG